MITPPICKNCGNYMHLKGNFTVDQPEDDFEGTEVIVFQCNEDKDIEIIVE
jgi:hypothetical protein